MSYDNAPMNSRAPSYQYQYQGQGQGQSQSQNQHMFASRPKIRHPNRPPCLTPSKTVYIRNLNEKTKPVVLAAALRALFETYGPVLTLRMRGQAFIVFKDTEHAVRAHSEVQGFMLFDKPIFAPAFRCHIADQGDPPIQERDARERDAQARVLAQPQAEAALASAAITAISALPPGVEIPNSILFLQGLPADIAVRWVSVKPDVAFVEFRSEIQAAFAKSSLASQLSLREGASPVSVSFANR
ncbi:hypothetical protein BX661DRAFT_179477 [Kickxella alabastrina]|uniref:uncharacterized protein n=1 Tax=Kickxella alabastrina TaxID=61397 RepID=UPI002220BA81|nr:uncharacterized protein BX661DRAFT_179477 [Kickxella alabastrina]KAI7831901.1 hypothetical protein BX661DRAFT_179477 [Kickxella alabastrina]